MSNRAHVVVVSGASAGIGRAAAEAFGRQGARVALIARDAERLEQAKSAVEFAGGEALAIAQDVTDAEGIDQAADRIEAHFGPIDVWVNSAMATVYGPFISMTPDEFRQVNETTYLGTVYGTMSALKRMQARNHGTIVQVGSALAYRGIPLQSAYCGAKHAIRGFTDSIRTELRYQGSRVNLTMVQLGAFNTPQFEWGRNHMERRPQPLPPIYQPEVAAEAIVWAARHPRREVSVGWASVMTRIGQKLAPRFMDWYMARNAWQGQLTGEPAKIREDNLFHPVSGPYGSHGRFNNNARRSSLQFELYRHRALVGLAVGTLAAAAVGYQQRRRR